MIARPAPLFDVEILRGLASSTLGVLQPGEPIVVLGSRQSPDELDDVALEHGSMAVRRRRGGGGAVLLRPEDRWVELWLRRTASSHDVRGAAYLVGGWWRDALAAHGVDAAMHRGGVLDADQGAVACFAGLGPGELTVQGHKILGISQWRVREGTLVSSVLPVTSPSDLLPYLKVPSDAVSRLSCAATIAEMAPALDVDAVLRTFVALASSDVAIRVDDAAFTAPPPRA